MINQCKVILCACLLGFSFMVQAVVPIVLKKETSTYIIDVKYPQGFKDEHVNKSIKDFIEFTRQSFFNELADSDDISADDAGKSGLNIIYSIPYQQNNALSVRFSVSVYHRGAAHPLNTVAVLNFINNRKIELSDVFIKNVDYLKPISILCNKAISAKDISDPKWIGEGTKPVAENYANWSFSSQGLEIIFDSYQVAAYVYGEQTVTIPLSAISTLVKPELLKTVWNH